MSLLWGMVNTARLATGSGEVAGVLRLLWRYLAWRVKGSPGLSRDETLRLCGATHILGMGTLEVTLLNEIYWERVYDRLQDFVPQPGWIVFDVGANVGIYAVQQAQRGARVYAFEPNPDCYGRLQKCVRANNVENCVTAFNYALGATAESAELIVPKGVTVLGSLRPEWTPGAGAISLRVEVETVDRVTRALGIGRIDLLKLDVEGLELDVLQGALETLAIVERLIIEYHSLDLRRRLVNLLAEHNLTIMQDEKTYHGDEESRPGFGRGLLYAKRQAGTVTGQPGPAIAVA